MEKRLAKITEAEFGMIGDSSFMFGLKLSFGGEGWGVDDGCKYTVNIGKSCKWRSPLDRLEACTRIMDFAADLLNQAKVQNVSQLRGKPVEITLDNRAFSDFRILTEVL